MNKEVFWELDAQERRSFRGLIAGVRESPRGFIGAGARGAVQESWKNEGAVSELEDASKKRSASGLARGVEISIVPVGVRGDILVPREGEWF